MISMLSTQVVKKKSLHILLIQNITCPYDVLTQKFSKCSPWRVASALPGNTLEMQILPAHPRPNGSEPVELEPSICVHKPSS